MTKEELQQQDLPLKSESGSVPLVNLSRTILPGDLTVLSGDAGRALSLAPTVQAALEQVGDGRVMVLVDDPIESITKYISGGQIPSIAVKSWKNDAQTLLSSVREHRRSIFMITIAMLERPTAELRQNLKDVLGVYLTGTKAYAENAEQLAELRPQEQLLGMILLQVDNRAKDLANEIWAMLPTREANETNSLESADNAFEDLASKASEWNDLQAQHVKLQATLKLKAAELTSTEKKYSQLIAIGANRESVLGAVLMQSCDELDRLRHDIDRLQDHVGTLEEDRDANTRQIGKLRAELTSLRSSLAWKITAPLRAIGRGLGRS